MHLVRSMLRHGSGLSRSMQPVSTTLHTAAAHIPGVSSGQPMQMPGTRTLDILFLTTAHNSLSQRALLELRRQKHRVTVELATTERDMIEAKRRVQPHLIICPFLTARVPNEIWSDSDTPCLIVHPGVQGDRGISAIDWALKRRVSTWGVTVLQAEDAMDTGPVWSSRTFPVKRDATAAPITKSSLYKHEVVDTAIDCINESISKYLAGIPPTPLDYSNSGTIGQLNPTMKQVDRQVDWHMPVEDIVHRINYSDSQPGVKMNILDDTYFAYGAFGEQTQSYKVPPGTMIGKRFGAVCFRALDGIVWIRTLKKQKFPVKLPAVDAIGMKQVGTLPNIPEPPTALQGFSSPLARPTQFQDIWTCTNNGVCYVNFDFVNGACSTRDCRRLEATLNEIKADPFVRAVVLLGGYDTFSNGINLNVIQGSKDPYAESVDNINAINDVIRTVFTMRDKLTISVFQGNAGAGGVMMALASDLVWAHAGVVLNPHYRLMALHGSEYWTYFLPNRVGHTLAAQLTDTAAPISAKYAHDINMIDQVVGANVEQLRSSLVEQVENTVMNDVTFNRIVKAKLRNRDDKWHQMVEGHRDKEMAIMKLNFSSAAYNWSRNHFVMKMKPLVSPAYLPRIRKPKVMKGKRIQNVMLEDIRRKINDLVSSGHRPPSLKIILHSEISHASKQYIHNKIIACNKVGMRCELVYVKAEDAESLQWELIHVVEQCNEDEEVDGIIVQLPLPAEIDAGEVINSISPHKDADGKTNFSLGALSRNQSMLRVSPATPRAVVRLLLEYGIQMLGRRVVVIGNSAIVGTPMAKWFLNEGATVTVCHMQTPRYNLRDHVAHADILVSAVGVPDLLDQSWLKEGAIVVNVGMTKMSGGKFLGDININPELPGVSLYTEPTGGVGPLTVAMLLENTLQLKLHHMKHKERERTRAVALMLRKKEEVARLTGIGDEGKVARLTGIGDEGKVARLTGMSKGSEGSVGM